ncbi:ABC transporter ATP-binding protein [Azorhizobium sp. AG788]|uniref:ABC transporter ATP-binding protein n=1 Tax=Azorhizobium sp. AG788 TaxID=2183897 RepID=UPI00313878D9
MSAAGLSIQRLSAGYGRRPVIGDLTLAPFAPGQLTALVGPNAAGKSTLLRALAGLIPARGRLTLDETDLMALPHPIRARLVGFMPQALPQGIALTVMETVIAALMAVPLAAPCSAAEARVRAAALLAQMGIAGLALTPIDRLSGGQRQLVSLAQALVREPRVLLLDEPTSALDLRHQAVVMDLLRGLAAEGRIIVVVLHDLALAARHADHVVVLDRGTLATQGAPAEAITAAMLAAVYGVAGRVETCARGTLQVMVDAPLR